MSDSDKKEKVASALLDLTRREVLAWEKFEAGTEELPGDLGLETGPVYAALHEGMDLYLYREDGENGGGDEPAQAVLEVADPERGTEWTFPELEAVEELYDLADFRASGLEDWMDEVIEEAQGDAEAGEASSPSEESASEDVLEESAAEEDAPEGDPSEGNEPGEEESTEDDGEDPTEDAATGDAAGEKSPGGEVGSDEDSGIGEPQEEDVFGAGGGDFGSGEEGTGEDRIL